MPTITTKDGTQIFYKDWGKGQPIVFSHGWPLTADAWDRQMLFFGQQGYRVVAHDRRSHGRPGPGRVAKVVLVGAVPPLMLKTAANPDGTPIEAFDGIRKGTGEDRSQF